MDAARNKLMMQDIEEEKEPSEISDSSSSSSSRSDGIPKIGFLDEDGENN
jgi:hypothetical protein